MKISTIAIVISFLGATACASSTPTPELVNARQAYDRARTDPTASLVPDSVLSAKQALDKAESVHNSDPQSDSEKSYAYVAQLGAERTQVSQLGSALQQSQTGLAAETAARKAADARAARAMESLQKIA